MTTLSDPDAAPETLPQNDDTGHECPSPRNRCYHVPLRVTAIPSKIVKSAARVFNEIDSVKNIQLQMTPKSGTRYPTCAIKTAPFVFMMLNRITYASAVDITPNTTIAISEDRWTSEERGCSHHNAIGTMYTPAVARIQADAGNEGIWLIRLDSTEELA